MDTGALERMPHNRSNAAGAVEASERGFGAQKYASARAFGSPASQIRSDRCADVRRIRLSNCLPSAATPKPVQRSKTTQSTIRQHHVSPPPPAWPDQERFAPSLANS